MTPKQSAMFQTQDLPMFSGTAQAARVSTFNPQPVEYQDEMFDTCASCDIIIPSTDRVYTTKDGSNLCQYCAFRNPEWFDSEELSK